MNILSLIPIYRLRKKWYEQIWRDNTWRYSKFPIIRLVNLIFKEYFVEIKHYNSAMWANFKRQKTKTVPLQRHQSYIDTINIKFQLYVLKLVFRSCSSSDCLGCVIYFTWNWCIASSKAYQSWYLLVNCCQPVYPPLRICIPRNFSIGLKLGDQFGYFIKRVSLKLIFFFSYSFVLFTECNEALLYI